MGFSIQNGYVIYKRTENSPRGGLWESAYQSVLQPSSFFLYENKESQLKKVGAFLIKLGKQEMTKELALINKTMGTSYSTTTDIKIFIEKFNEVMIGVQQFKNVRKNLKEALNKTDNKHSKAPTLSSNFLDIFIKDLIDRINEFIRNNKEALLNKDFTAWTEQFDKIVDFSIQRSLEKTLLSGKDDKPYKELYEASQQITNFNQYFIQMIRSKINFDNIKSMLSDGRVKIKNKRNTGVSKTIKSKGGLNLGNTRKVATVGGSVQEFIESLSSQVGQAFQQSFSSSTRVASSEKMKIDTYTIFSFQQEIDAQKIIDELDDEMKNAESLLEATKIIDKFWEENLSKLDNNNFIVYGSTKAYSLDSSGFHAGGKRSFEDAKVILQQTGYDFQKVNNFINAIYNTGEGAIFHSEKEEFLEQAKTALSKAVANLLFDDWNTLGEIKNGAQAIHVLQLDAVQVPLSSFLIAAGQAMLNTGERPDQFIHISVKSPGAVKYMNENFSRMSEHEIIEKWNEQAEIARSQTAFSLTFLKNFKDLIAQWLY